MYASNKLLLITCYSILARYVIVNISLIIVNICLSYNLER